VSDQEYCGNCNGTGYVREGYDGVTPCSWCNVSPEDLLSDAVEKIDKLQVELVQAKASLFSERSAHEEIVKQWEGIVQEDEAIIESLRDEVALFKSTLADNEAYGMAVMTERDALRSALNHAVYMQDKIRAERDTAEDLAEKLRKHAKTEEDFHPRAVKLLRKRKPFLVVANDEPYYRQVYDLIRDNEMLRGEWTTSDQWRYEDAIAAWKDGQK
jgi:hypothetical protein